MRSKFNLGLVLAILALLVLLVIGLDLFSPGAGIESSRDDSGDDEAEAAAPVDAGGDFLDTEREAVAMEGAEADELSSEDSLSAKTVDLLKGRIVDEAGLGIPRAWVTTWREHDPVWTDDQGVFEIPLEGPLGRKHSRVIQAWAKGKEISYMQVFEPGFATMTLLQVQGRDLLVLRQDDQNPIQGAVARMLVHGIADPATEFFHQTPWSEVPLGLAPSDANGWILLPSIRAGFVHVSAPGYRDSLVNLSGIPGDWKVWLAPQQEFRIRLVLADGTPLAGAQLSFNPSMALTETDADGWTDVPPLAQEGYDSFAVAWQDRGFVFCQGGIRTSPIPPVLENGMELVVPYRTLVGSLTISGEGSPEDYEATTCAVRQWLGERHLPDPINHPDTFDWFPITPDGSFVIESGWQGLETQLHLRRKSDQVLVLKETLQGPGPFELNLALDAGHLARLRVLCDPIEALDGVELRLRADRVVGLDVPLPPFKLEEGKSEARLLPGTWSVRLVGQEFLHEPIIGRFVMPQEDAFFEFDLGRLRPLRGTLTARGKPLGGSYLQFGRSGGYIPEPRVFGGALLGTDFEAGFATLLKVGEDGTWNFGLVPDTLLEVRIMKTDPWLTPGPSFLWSIPPEQEFIDLVLPTGTLNLGFLGESAPHPSDITVERRELGDKGGEWIHSESIYGPPFPDLSQENAALTVFPSEIRWYFHDPLRLLHPTSVTLHEGEHLAVEIRVDEAGEVVAIWEAEDAPYGGKVLLENLDPMEGAFPPRLIASREFNGRAGGFAEAYSAQPGRWRFTLQGPIIRMDDVHLRPTEERYGEAGDDWTADIQVEAGKRTVVWVGLNADGGIRLRPEILVSDTMQK